MSEPISLSSANQMMLQGFSSPSLFIDNAIALETSKMIQKAMESKKRTAILVTILTIVGIDGIKKIITKIIDLFIVWCQELTWQKCKTGISMLKTICQLFFKLFRFTRSSSRQEIITKKNNINVLETVRFQTNYIFWKALLYHPSFSSNLIITKLSICDGTGLMNQDELWMDCKIDTPEWTAYLLNTMSFSTQLIKNRRELLQKTMTTKTQDCPNIVFTIPNESMPYHPNTVNSSLQETYPRIELRGDNYFLQCNFRYDSSVLLKDLYLLNIIPTELYLITDVIFDLIYNVTSFPHYSNNTKGPCKENEIFIFEHYKGMEHLWNYLLYSSYNTPEYAGSVFLINLYILLIIICISFQFNELYYNILFRQIHRICLLQINGETVYLGQDKQFREQKNIPIIIDKEGLLDIKRFITDYITPKLNANPKIKSILPLFRYWFITTYQLEGLLGYNPEDIKQESNENPEISLFIQPKISNKSISTVDLLHSFSTFSKKLIQDYTTQREGSPVSINYLRIVESTIISKIENPEYKEWKELYAPKTNPTELSLSKSEDKVSSDTMLLSYLMKNNSTNSSIPPSPPMYTTETNVKRDVSVEKVNNSYKNVKTLYLCDQDKKKLFNCLDVFKNKRELLESLGLPHKLGVLLYGEPGCGKSSAILAIASFLQKDIFYIDLKTVKTNQELKMIFDHVYTLNANGGIIAMEDIDCASNIVLQRKDTFTIEGSNNNEDNLTLDFLLNLLQGTLTKDGTVFIATTNYIHKLDTALVRDGRFDIKIELKKCNKEQLSQMFEIFFDIKLTESLLLRFREFEFIPATILSRMSEYLTSGNVIIPEEVLSPFLHI